MPEAQIFEIDVAATPEQVWRALTNPEMTRRYLYGTAIDPDLAAGSTYAYRMPSGEPAEQGTVLELEPPRRLRLTSRLLFDPQAAEEPPHRVTWEIAAFDSGSRVRVTCDEYTGEASSRIRANGMPLVLKGLKLMAETGGVTQRVERVGALTIREVNRERLGDYLRFFDQDAFADNPAWSDCYCMAPYFAGTDEEQGLRTAEQNRSGMIELFQAGRAQGLLAYADGKPVGWCNAAPRTLLRGVERDVGSGDDAERVGAIACFVIAAPYRRHGVARALLDAACERFREMGLSIVEAYPRRGAETDAHNFTGPLQMYLDAGFRPHRESGSTIVVRRDLTAPHHEGSVEPAEMRST
jgi:uncharacterized protein YndB with AHSA1/START domain/GNAT superfamily N-acetyltransferase